MSKQASEAIRAAKNAKSWGKFAAYMYAKKSAGYCRCIGWLASSNLLRGFDHA